MQKRATEDDHTPVGTRQSKRITRNRISHSCRSCRIKRVQCNRLRPSCKHCLLAGSECIYDDTNPEAQTKRRRLNAELDSPFRTPTGTSLPDSATSNDQPVEDKSTVKYSSQQDKHDDGVDAGEYQAKVGYLSIRNGGQSRYVSSTFWAYVCDNEEELGDFLHDQDCYSSRDIPFQGEASETQVGSPASQACTSQQDISTNSGSTAPQNRVPGFEAASCKVVSPEIDSNSHKAVGKGTEVSPLSNILCDLPDRVVCDEYYQSYIDSFYPIIPLLHLPTFQGQYLSFWEWRNFTGKTTLQGSIIATCPSFLPLLFSVLFAGSVTRASRGQDSQPAVEASAKLYRSMLRAQSFVAFPQKPTLYSLIAFLISQNLTIKEEEPLLACSYISTAIRIAQIMGLHRDGSLFNLDPIEAETRRRVWWHIIHTDVMTATIAALPPLMVSDRLYDTKMMSEIRDDYIINDSEASTSGENQIGRGMKAIDDKVDPRLVLCIARYQITTVMRQILRRQFDIEPFALSHCLEMKKSVDDLYLDTQACTQRLRSLHKYRNKLSRESHSPNDAWKESLGDSSIRLYLSSHEDDFIESAVVLLNLMIDKTYCLLYQPFAKDRKSQVWLKVRSDSIKHSQSFIRTFISIATSPLYARFRWLYPGLYQPLHVTALLLVDLRSNPAATEAPDSLALIDRLFSIMTDNGVESSDHGIFKARQLSPGGREAWILLRKLRYKTWEALGLDPGKIWSFAQGSSGVQDVEVSQNLPTRNLQYDSGLQGDMSSNMGSVEWPYINDVIPMRDSTTDEPLVFPGWEQMAPDPFQWGNGVDLMSGWAQQELYGTSLFGDIFAYDSSYVDWQAVNENGNNNTTFQ